MPTRESVKPTVTQPTEATSLVQGASDAEVSKYKDPSPNASAQMFAVEYLDIYFLQDVYESQYLKQTICIHG